MADGVTIPATGSGTATPVVATDDAGASGHVQLVKLAISTDGSATAIPAEATNGLDVDVTRVQGTVTVGDGGSTISVDDGAGSLTVDVGTALPAGTNNIGDVDIATVPAPLSTTGGGTEATALRVTVATDSTGVVSVDDNGGSLTVDGSVSITGAVDTELTTADLDTGAGTDTRAVVGLVGSKSGGGALIPGDATAGLKVDLGADNDVVVSDGGNVISVDDAGSSLTVDNAALAVVGGGAEATALRVTVANDSTGVVSVDDNGGSLTIDGSVSLAAAVPAGTNNIGDVDVASIAAGDNNIGNVDIASALPTGANTIGAVTPLPLATGGCDIFRSLDLDETEEEVKATAGTLYGWYIANLATSTRFVKFYNATAATVMVGTTAPVMTLPIPGNSTDDIAANLLGGVGIKFDTAITVAATTGVADADTGAPAANDVVVNLYYR